MLKAMALALILIVSGCHGADVRLGTGRVGQSLDASGSSGYGSKASSWAVSSDDATSYWIELGFQLSPQTIRFEPTSHGGPVLGLPEVAHQPTHLTPPGCHAHGGSGVLPAPVEEPCSELAAQVASNTARLDAARKRMDRSLGPIELLLGGGATSVAVIASFLGVRAFRRRRADACAEEG